MNSTTARHSPAGFALPRNAPAAARTTLQLLQRIRHGSLSVTLPDGTVQRFGSADGPHASIQLHNWNVCGAALKSGDIGFAESYIAGDWSTPNLSALLGLLLANRREVDKVIYGSWLGRLAYRVRHLLNRNSKANSRRNIHAHYDLGNAFYRLWLDETMNYSSAWFERPDMDMVQAQHAKVRRALKSAGVQADDRVLEIGCGWGALAEMATAEFGARITGVTLSTEQLEYATRRLEAAGDRADLRLMDYRDINDGPYDAICSIEMVEAVGQEYWPTYFKAVHDLLKPGGQACIQSIVIDDALFDRYVSGTDFIQQYIFPGGCLPCPREFRQQARQAGLEVVDEFAFGQDYARTLAFWRERFLQRQDEVLRQGFDTPFLRVWEFYLAYCEAAFAQASIDVVQYTLRRPA
ncbi:MAG TPA: cyclopropane-fatty-acyl-phospholipid synthase family protein [Hydrogenophaga sp.]|uniref:cyclopropane-fatty-acyl-phospholipid synthase family protein n=1 Tax=Hydrogenophaga sp. TaxID=1904254 RepID=UPI002BEBF2F8|nr:cyclopropane-fatty-acyl-phospholipid synthase family protein [Hydrogenophaga sp.]HMN91970.1 cyclopropane-fatty-acyl-phospholipid synthase family protein [Hydrogenophaga sp.]HMP08772.1 cyclopropane-fatty-acyl-phospholipid synthase family protein [Hydrogenophaga sp.]